MRSPWLCCSVDSLLASLRLAYNSSIRLMKLYLIKWISPSFLSATRCHLRRTSFRPLLGSRQSLPVLVIINTSCCCCNMETESLLAHFFPSPLPYTFIMLCGINRLIPSSHTPLMMKEHRIYLLLGRNVPSATLQSSYSLNC